MLDYSYHYPLVIASMAIALMAGFTGLSLTRGASLLSVPHRKLVVAMSAVALGGGIWSMHFVAMLGVELPILFYYDALTTLISALVAILITGIALLILHFGTRTRARILSAGVIVGAGIPVMHYLGMSGMELCQPVYEPWGVVLAVMASVGLSVAAFGLAYGKRGSRNILLGTVGFGLAVFAVHFIAMAGTGFVEVQGAGLGGAPMSNEVLAFGVTLAAFVISGAFLLTGVSFTGQEEAQAATAPVPVPAPDQGSAAPQMAEPAIEAAEMPEPLEVPVPQLMSPPAPLLEPAHPAPQVASPPTKPPATPSTTPPTGPPQSPAPIPASSLAEFRLPYEKDGRTHFVDSASVAAVRAEGHYTLLYVGADKLFCPWSIAEVEKRGPTGSFVRTHRSYLVNTRLVSGFERRKDSGICYFDGVEALSKVPVSRSRLAEVRDILGV